MMVRLLGIPIVRVDIERGDQADDHELEHDDDEAREPITLFTTNVVPDDVDHADNDGSV